MAADNPRGAMFRVLMPERQARVTNAELFFDLVFVYAVTQLSHTLLHHFTPLGAVQVTLLFLAVWWVWVYTTWVTNWLDPERTPVRILLFLLMLGGLVLSTSIPKAFEERGLWFAGAYAAMQVGRTAFWLLATPKHRTLVRHNATRILVWLCFSAVFWILGGLAEGEMRLYFWIVALAIEYVSAAVRFWTPGLGFSSMEAWTVEGGHMRTHRTVQRIGRAQFMANAAPVLPALQRHVEAEPEQQESEQRGADDGDIHGFPQSPERREKLARRGVTSQPRA